MGLTSFTLRSPRGCYPEVFSLLGENLVLRRLPMGAPALREGKGSISCEAWV